MIDGFTRTCGVFGNPVEHTMSPAIHNFLAEQTGRNLVYIPCHVETGQLEAAIKGAFALNLLGANVTVPYKSDVISYLKEVDSLAAQIGAVNTLVRMEDGYKGYNTDMPGLYRAMGADGIGIEGERVLILGAGGVARAVAMLLTQKNAAEIVLLNRTVEKAQAIADEVNDSGGKRLARAISIADFDTLPADVKYLAIQATNVGMYPKTEACVIEEETFYRRIHTGYDLIFNPLQTKFMRLVEAQGGKAFNGLKMLLYQGIIAYELWTGCTVSEELARRTYGNMLAAMRERHKD